MKIIPLFGKKPDAQPPEIKNDEDELEIYSGMRVEVTALDGRMLFVAKLMGLHGNQAELHQYSEAAISQEEPFPVRIRGYSDRDRKAVSMEGVIAPLPQNKWSVAELKVCRIGNDRAFFRLDTNLDATATTFSGLAMGEKPCKLLNISIGGACISSESRYHKGDKFLLKVRLLEGRPESTMFAQIVRVVEKDNIRFEYGCQFLELTEAAQDQISENIFAAQRMQGKEKLHEKVLYKANPEPAKQLEIICENTEENRKGPTHQMQERLTGIERPCVTDEFEWREDLNIGVDVIDKEHQRLFRIINRLLAFREKEKDSQWASQEGIKYFKGHAMKHFEDEEAYMASIGYEGLEHHRLIHRGFREDTLPALERELKRSNYAPEAVDHFLGVCSGWLIGHTVTEDQAIVGKYDQRWTNRFTSQERADIKKVITQLLFDMFHLEAHLVSDTYAGEKFGNGLYYRLVWGCPQEEKKLEIFLVFEEQLLVSMIGKSLGLKTNNLNSMLLHAARYSSRQLVTRAMECFPDLNDYRIEEENFLSHEQFRDMMAKGEHQLSLLLDTGAGYFGYCVVAPHLLDTGVGICITGDNAAAEVTEYLAQRKKQLEEERSNPKRKILVVDDSVTICRSIAQLLEPDYEVAQAESGVAAIRSITLNRPDLILLDYEMPVVNGRQTLEMLRCEKSFSDIPVIFLTGRSDPELVTNLLALKPAGYLLKNLKPAEIKAKVDAFFAKSKL